MQENETIDTLTPQNEEYESQENNSMGDEETPPVSQAAPMDQDHPNFKTLREQRKQAERERDEALARLREYEKSVAKKHAEAKDNTDDDLGISEEDLVEGKHLKKYIKRMRQLEENLQKYQQNAELTSVESRLKSQYPDFESVVSEKNIQLLNETYPEIAQTLASSPDMYKKAVSAYTMIKKLGIDGPDYKEERSRTEQNAAKPRPLASVSPQRSDSPLSHANAFANGLTDDLKKQLLKEMSEARRNY